MFSILHLVRSKTFRITLIYLCLFSVSTFGLLGFVYWSTTGAVSRQIDSTIEVEITGLAEQYNQRGMMGLLAAIERRSAAPDGSGVYLLSDARLRPLAGNLDRWPDAPIDGEGWTTFRLEASEGEGGGVNFGRGRVFQLSGGLQLLVGHDIRERSYVEGLIRETLVWSLAAILILSLAAGLIVSRILLGRVEVINRTSREIMGGDLGRRIPQRGNDDEFDQLAGNLNAMLDRIEHLLEGMRQVSDNIAHDLRSPLARLRSRLEVTLMEAPDVETCRRVMQETIVETDQLLKTFNSLLLIAQTEAGTDEGRFSEVSLDSLAADVADLYGPLAEEKGLSLNCGRLERQTLRGDRNLLFQALANLLDNAIKFSPSGSETTLSLVREGNDICFSIGDRGPGIPENVRGRVLDRFFRLESSRSTPGSGLGLSLASAVAKLHGGTLMLRDNGPGLLAQLRLPLGAKLAA